MSCECECEQEQEQKKQPSDIVVGVQFEARDIEPFLDAFERARLAVEALGQEVTVTAQAMERLGRANRSVRHVLHRPWWKSGAACTAAGAWLVTVLSLIGLILGTEHIVALSVTVLLGLSIAAVASAVASGRPSHREDTS